MNKLPVLLFTFLIILFSNQCLTVAKNYDKAIGIRGGLLSGISYKQFISSDNALEFYVTGNKHTLYLAGEYEFYNNTKYSSLDWYYGGGIYSSFYEHDSSEKSEINGGMVIGVNGILGIEYNFKKIPLNISLDWNPSVNLVGGVGFLADRGAISIRYYW